MLAYKKLFIQNLWAVHDVSPYNISDVHLWSINYRQQSDMAGMLLLNILQNIFLTDVAFSY
jgi:hypothetical protein